VIYKNTAIAVTSDHLFLTENRKLKRADRLAPGDHLVDPQGLPVTIKSVHIGTMRAGFHHIATRKEEPSADLEGHLLNTNGVVSADYAVQMFYRVPANRRVAFAGNGSTEHDNLPIVGSSAYVSKYGESSLLAPNATNASFMGDEDTGLKNAEGETFLRVGLNNAPDQSNSLFIPADATKTKIPSHAHSFISRTEADQRALSPKRAFNDPRSRGWTEWLLEYHSYFYPEIGIDGYTLDWSSDEVNAYAWVELGTGKRRVDIKGGLVRDIALNQEAIALVIAHETGHHYGGAPTHGSGLSCEGQADYEAVATVMRKVWYGSDYFQKVKPAISQMADFFNVPDSPTVPGGTAGCSHPAGSCRIATYYAAAALESKPGCAS
jgi:hypothetical protein